MTPNPKPPPAQELGELLEAAIETARYVQLAEAQWERDMDGEESSPISHAEAISDYNAARDVLLRAIHAEAARRVRTIQKDGT